jgi:hypothetical protein
MPSRPVRNHGLSSRMLSTCDRERVFARDELFQKNNDLTAWRFGAMPR